MFTHYTISHTHGEQTYKLMVPYYLTNNNTILKK